MGVFKNEVGRPSNETIKKRNIFKGICVLLIIVVICLITYILNDKGLFSNEESNNKTTTQKSVVDTFDKSQVVTKDEDGDEFYDIYVYGQKLNFEGVLGISRIEVIEDVAIIEMETINVPYLLVVNTKGEVLYSASDNENMLYYCSKKSSECYDYKVENNKIKFYKESLGQDKLRVCSASDDLEVLVEYELTYENGKITKKELNKITAKEYIEKHNFDCSK